MPRLVKMETLSGDALEESKEDPKPTPRGKPR